MKDLVMEWQVNHNIQYVLDAYSCLMYICGYMTKAQKDISTLMAETCKEAKYGNMTLKQECSSHGKEIAKCCRITSNGGILYYN